MRLFGIVSLILLLGISAASTAHAALVEMSAMGSLAKANFSDGYSYKQQRLSGSIEFKFTPVSGIQFEYSDTRTTSSYNTTVGTLLPTTTKEFISYRDKVYSFNLVQNLVPAKWLIQPYVKLGGGKMHRVYTREIPEFNVKDVVTQKVTSGVGGVGIRIFLLKNLAIKGEMSTYVPDFRFSRWKENQLFSAGVSWLF